MKKSKPILLFGSLGTVVVSGLLAWGFFFSRPHYTVEVFDTTVKVLAFEVSRGKTNEFESWSPGKWAYELKCLMSRIGLERWVAVKGHHGISSADQDTIWLRAHIESKFPLNISPLGRKLIARNTFSGRLTDERGRLIPIKEESFDILGAIGNFDDPDNLWTISPPRRTNLNHCTLELFTDKAVVAKIHIQE